MRFPFEALRGKKNLVGCEIGVASGENAKDILINLDIAKIYLVDPMWLSEEGFKRAKARLNLYLDKIVWIAKKSEDVTIEEIPHNSLDFCYIDGDHTYDAVRKDLELYWLRVKKNGLFAGHDYGQENGVKQAVDEFFKGKGFLYKKNYDWWVYK